MGLWKCSYHPKLTEFKANFLYRNVCRQAPVCVCGGGVVVGDVPSVLVPTAARRGQQIPWNWSYW